MKDPLEDFILEPKVLDQPETLMQGAVREILRQIQGEDPLREGLLKTPERVARMYYDHAHPAGGFSG